LSGGSGQEAALSPPIIGTEENKMFLRLGNLQWSQDGHLPGNWPRRNLLIMDSFVRQMNVRIFY